MKTKKIVYGGIRGYNNAVERHKEKGWEVTNEEQIPRPRKRITHIATLKR